jgi:hypothetical protein
MLSLDQRVAQKRPSQMLLLGKIASTIGFCLLVVAGAGATKIASGLSSEALVWASLAGGAGLIGGAVLVGFGVLEQRLLAQSELLQALHQSAEFAPAAAPAETPVPFRSRPAAIGQRRLKLI